MSIRLILVHDHRLLREALRAILQESGDIELVAEADNGAAALELARELAPDVVLIHIDIEGMSGIETTRRMLAAKPGTKVLGMSTNTDRRILLQLLEAGARGYVAKSAGSEELLQGIRAVADGQSYLHGESAAVIVDRLRKHSQSRQNEALGRREREVLRLLADGKTSAQIAEALHIVTATVEVHRRNIMRKLDLHNVAELTKYAIRKGFTSA